jgi:hypothetical protein
MLHLEDSGHHFKQSTPEKWKIYLIPATLKILHSEATRVVPHCATGASYI